MFHQVPLFTETGLSLAAVPFPTTRYQGSKRKLIDWLWENIKNLPFQSALDVFGGTAVVSHLFKRAGKRTIYNDYLSFNQQIGMALIENSTLKLTEPEITNILEVDAQHPHPTIIQQNFAGIYYTDAENAWLDRTIYAIRNRLTNPYKQALAYYGLFQACLAKRPFNLFHRANLYMRLAQVRRQFGNKTTWDTPFEVHFRAAIAEANQAIFDNHQQNIALNVDALETPTGIDLVYLDPPYLNAKGVGVDYHTFYHFLEGIVRYDRWVDQIDFQSRHRRLQPLPSGWTNANTILSMFEALIARHQQSIIVLSYRDDGIPSKAQLIELLHAYKPHVQEASHTHQYALSRKELHEILLIAH